MLVRITRLSDTGYQKLFRFGDELRGPLKRELLRAAAYEFWSITREAFGANRPNRPAQWAPLKDSTIKRYRAKYYGANLTIPTLLRSGLLMNSIRMEVSNDEYATVWQDSTQAIYGATHQFGRGAIPARPFFPVIGDRLTPYAQGRMYRKFQEVLALRVR